MPRLATIGPEIFERVNALVAEGKSRTEAFAQVGQERNSRPGTVAANYYRVARSQGQTGGRRSSASARTRRRTADTTRSSSSSTRRARGSASSRRSGGSANGDGDLRQIAQQIAELTQRLVQQVEERDQKIRRLLA